MGLDGVGVEVEDFGGEAGWLAAVGHVGERSYGVEGVVVVVGAGFGASAHSGLRIALVDGWGAWVLVLVWA